MNAVFRFVLPDELREKVDRIAKQRNTTASAIMRDLLTDFVKNESDIEILKQRVDALEKEVFGKKKKNRSPYHV